MKRSAILLMLFFLAASAGSSSYCDEIAVKEWTPIPGTFAVVSKNNVFLNAERFKVLSVRLKPAKSYSTGRLFFRRIGDMGFKQHDFVEFQTGPAGAYRTSFVDCGKNPDWAGTITQLALVPDNEEGSFEIKDIKFLESDLRLKFLVFWKEFFAFERPLPRTINFIYGPRINGISVNTYIYSLMILISLSLIAVYWIKFNEPGKLLNVIWSKIIIVCFIFWILLDARTALDQFRSAVIDFQTFGGKSLEERRALATNGTYYDFYNFLAFCKKYIPAGSTYSLVVPPDAAYFEPKSMYYLFPICMAADKAEYTIVYDPWKLVKKADIPEKGYRKIADLGDRRYILKRSAGL